MIGLLFTIPRSIVPTSTQILSNESKAPAFASLENYPSNIVLRLITIQYTSNDDHIF